MKKSVVILIGVIYIASIALVSFFGLKFKSYNEKIYVNSIEITNHPVQKNELGEKYVVIRPDSEGKLSYKIEYKITPDDATTQDVSFVYDRETAYVSVSDDGTVTFDRSIMPAAGGSVVIEVVSTDGTGVKDVIKIYARTQ